MNTEFDRIVVIDFETTGTSRDKRAVEVAWFELNKNLEIIDEQVSFINPMIPIPWEVIAIHGITDDMVKDSPTLDEFIVDIQQDTFANSSVCVVAHNLPFDLPLFKKYCGNVVELCTLKLARNIYPELNNHKLGTISERFGFVHEEAHRARSDASQVVQFLKMVKETHGLSIYQMIDKTIPKSGKQLSKVGDKTNLVPSNIELRDEPIDSRAPNSELISTELVSGSLTYDFTKCNVTFLMRVFNLLQKQGIEFTWSGRIMTVSKTCEGSVDAIVSEVQESWKERNGLISALLVSESFTYDFTDWDVHSTADLCSRLYHQNIETNWSGNLLTVSETCEDSVDAIVSEVQESWNEKTSDEESGSSHKIVEYLFYGAPISELADLVNDLNGYEIGHEWIGHHLLVSSDDELVVDEIIGELSLNPNFAVNSLEEFRHDDSDKYRKKGNWKTNFTFPYFTIPQLVDLENELVEKEVTHFWDEQFLHVSESDVEIVKIIIKKEFGISR